MNKSTNFTTPFHIWKFEVEMAAIAQGGKVEFFPAQRVRIAMWFDAGEPVWMASDSLARFSIGSKAIADQECHRKLFKSCRIT